MQIGGIGSELNSHSSSHQLTECMHDHDTQKSMTGGMRMTSAAQVEVKTTDTEKILEGMSLTDALRNTLSAGKRLLGRIWSGGDGSGIAANGSGGEKTASAEQLMAQVVESDLAEESGAAGFASRDGGDGLAGEQEVSVPHAPRVAAAATAVQSPQTVIQNNPYFTTTSDTGVVKENIFQKIRVKFQDITKQLTKRFFGGASGHSSVSDRHSSLNSRRERSREDLRKHSRYRDKDVEIDCVLTDDSYLMDSYDRKGEYSRLTTETKH